MGSNFATELAEMDLGLSMEDAIGIHLQANHYPPVPRSMVQPCMEAIQNYNEGFHNEPVELPEGVFWRGDTIAPSWAIIESHHLDAWLWDNEE